MHYAYYAGLDLGQARDYSALTILEPQLWVSEALAEREFSNRMTPELTGWRSPAELTPHQTRAALLDMSPLPDKPPLHVKWLERLPLDTPYPQIVEHVSEIVRRPLFAERGVALLIDQTGVGAPVFDMFVQAGLRPIAITITGGNEVNRARNGYHVPKRDLVGAARAAFQTRRLLIPDTLPGAAALQKELQSFKIKINLRTAHDSYEAWREGDHDDLVLSLAMPVWFRDQWNRNLDKARLQLPQPGTVARR